MDEKSILQNLVNESNSLSEILRKQGKAISGKSVDLLKQKLNEYNIEYNFNYKSFKEREKSLDEIMVENSSYKSQDLKRRLIKAGLKEDICELCGQSNVWNGQHLVLQLDHINGNHYDNRFENLRILCPNCHSQTETFGNKRNKKTNYCIDCGKEISIRSTRCQSCAAKYSNKRKVENRPTKEELLKLILNNTFVAIGEMYGVTDNTIRKWCKYYGLPYTKKDIKLLNSPIE